MAPTTNSSKTSSSSSSSSRLTPHINRLLRLIEHGTTHQSRTATQLLTNLTSSSSSSSSAAAAAHHPNQSSSSTNDDDGDCTNTTTKPPPSSSLLLWDILGRIASSTLRSESWDCRINASYAMTYLSRNIPKKEVRSFLLEGVNKLVGGGNDDDDGSKLWLTVENVEKCFERVLTKGRPLLAMDEKVYEYESEDGRLRRLDDAYRRRRRRRRRNEGNDDDDDDSSLFVVQRVRYQRRILARRLGLDFIMDSGCRDEEWGGDLLLERKDVEVVSEDDAKQNKGAGHFSSTTNSNGDNEEEDDDRIRPLLLLLQNSSSSRSSSSHQSSQTLLATELLYHLVDPDWRIRHGALSGLLSLCRHWMMILSSSSSSSSSSSPWVEDILCRCLCLLGLDRFGDYGGGGSTGGGGASGDVVAPVRELAGQLMAVTFQGCCYYHDNNNSSSITKTGDVVWHILEKLVTRTEGCWEVRHGGFVGVKYLVAMMGCCHNNNNNNNNDYETTTATRYHDRATRWAINGLKDDSDDVKSVSAQVLREIIRQNKNRRRLGLSEKQSTTTTGRHHHHLSKVGCMAIAVCEGLSLIPPISTCSAELLLLFADLVSIDGNVVWDSLNRHDCRGDNDIHESRRRQPAVRTILMRVMEYLDHDDGVVRLASVNALGQLMVKMIKHSGGRHGDDDHDEDDDVGVLVVVLRRLFEMFFVSEEESMICALRNVWNDVVMALQSSRWLRRYCDDNNGSNDGSSLVNVDGLFYNVAVTFILRSVGIETRRNDDDGDGGEIKQPKKENSSQQQQQQQTNYDIVSSLSLLGSTTAREMTMSNSGSSSCHQQHRRRLAVGENFDARFVIFDAVATFIMMLIRPHQLPSSSSSRCCRRGSGGLFVQGILNALLSSPWYDVAEGGCLLYRSLTKIVSANDSSSSSSSSLSLLSDCHDTLLNMFETPPTCITMEFNPLLKNHGVRYVCDNALQLVLESVIMKRTTTTTTTTSKDDDEISSSLSSPSYLQSLWKRLLSSSSHQHHPTTPPQQQQQPSPPTTRSIRFTSLVAGSLIIANHIPPKKTPLIRSLVTLLQNEHSIDYLTVACDDLVQLLLHPIMDVTIVNKILTNVLSSRHRRRHDEDDDSGGAVVSSYGLLLLQKLLSSSSYPLSRYHPIYHVRLSPLLDISTIIISNNNNNNPSSLPCHHSTPSSLISSLSLLQSIAPSLHSQSLSETLEHILPATIHLCTTNANAQVRLMSREVTTTIVALASSSSSSLPLEKLFCPRPFPMLLNGSSSNDDAKVWGASLLLLSLLQHDNDDRKKTTTTTTNNNNTKKSKATTTTIDCRSLVTIVLSPVMSNLVHTSIDIRQTSAHIFNHLIRLAPLIPPSSSSSSKGGDVISHLIHGQPLPPPPPLPHRLQLKLKLRKYQWDGVSWMLFLRSVNLNGALCDDMGLGKTVQSLIVVILGFWEEMKKTKRSQKKTKKRRAAAAAALVVCPNTLVGHWEKEVTKFFEGVVEVKRWSSSSTDQVAAMGDDYNNENVLLEANDDDDDDDNDNDEKVIGSIVIASYYELRLHVKTMERIDWFYVILDEGHLLKNPKTLTARASKRLKSRHRLLLTGTPVQNNVEELWAVFDFLMPHFLFDEKTFKSQYAKPILKSHLPDATASEINDGMEKLKSLHQRVLPFILRREKSDVLKELPPKVIVDIPCVLSREQMMLYNGFLDRVGSDIVKRLTTADDDNVGGGEEDDDVMLLKEGDVLKSLLYLRLVCTHPALVVTADEGDGVVSDGIGKRSKQRQQKRRRLRRRITTSKTTPAISDSVRFDDDNDDDDDNVDDDYQQRLLRYASLDHSGKLTALNDLLRTANIYHDDITSAADNDRSVLYLPDDDDDDDRNERERKRNGTLVDVNEVVFERPPPTTRPSKTTENGNNNNHHDDGQQQLPASSPPKCLIFAQFSRSLDIIENYLFRPHMPSLRYVRLDGRVPSAKRSAMVDRFNRNENDGDDDDDDLVTVMLLTTKVGGLGLNLTGANIVVFFEHDWNPHVDLQAMDRAHRIGQTKTVTVYRLVTTNTIEEKIMNIQKRKQAVSDAIVNSENSTMYSMGTDRLLDIFACRPTSEGSGSSSNKKNNSGGDDDDMKGVLESLDDLYTEDEYKTLSVEGFLNGFAGSDGDNCCAEVDGEKEKDHFILQNRI